MAAQLDELEAELQAQLEEQKEALEAISCALEADPSSEEMQQVPNKHIDRSSILLHFIVAGALFSRAHARISQDCTPPTRSVARASPVLPSCCSCSSSWGRLRRRRNRRC